MEEFYEGGLFCRDFTFRFGDCNAEKQASLFSIMKLLSEIAGDDYEGRGLGHTVLWKHQQAFLLSRMAMRFQRLPEYGQKTTASTWERYVKGVFFCRDYEIRSKDGDILVSANSLWFLINPISREVLRPGLFIGKIPEDMKAAADCPKSKRLRIKDGMPILGIRPIKYSDIDANGHVNNAVYGRIVDDFLPKNLRRSPEALFIDFKSEVKLGENLEIRGEPSENGYSIQGISEASFCFGAELVFKDYL